MVRSRFGTGGSLPGFALCGVAMVLLLAEGGTMDAQGVPAAVAQLDMKRFAGVWYEAAAYPNKLEKHCVSDAVAIYTPVDKPRRFAVVNSCKTGDGSIDTKNGSGKAQDKSGDGKLKVAYTWPFYAKYWVLGVGPEYEWAVVGSPNRKFLWVLTRASKPGADVLAAAKAKAGAEGFDLSKLVMRPQTR